MDETRRWFFEVRADETIKNLIKHEFDSLRVAERSAACSEILRRIPTTKTVGVGGSVTLGEIGIIDKLQEQGNVIYDHWKQGLSEEDSLRIRKMQQSSDVFLTSANAVTLSGEIVSIDGFGNRISSMMFGPKEVMIVAGYNKIVRDIPEAMNRIKTLAAGLEGIEKKYPLRDPVERNVYEMTEKERKKYKSTPCQKTSMKPSYLRRKAI